MKFLECPKLLALTNALSGTNLGDRVVHGRIESYTCKSVKAEKALSKEIEKQLVVEASTSPGGPNGAAAALASPLGPLNSTATRKLLVNLITTMNASFPDYDFSNLRPEQFEHETSRFVVQSSVNNMLLNGMEQIQPGFRDLSWKTIDEAIELDKCEIYNYIPDMDSDLGEGKLWSFNYFFFNKKKKTLVLFSAYAVSKMRGNKLAVDDDLDADMDDDVDADADDGQPLDWDDLNMDGTPTPTKATGSSGATAAAPAVARVGSVPASPFVGASMSPSQAPMHGSSGHNQPQPLHLHPPHPHAHTQHQHSFAHSHTAQPHALPHPAMMAAAPAATPAAAAAATAASNTILMGPATPHQQALLHAQQMAAAQQKRASASAPQPIPQPAGRPGLIMMHGVGPARAASIVGQPQHMQLHAQQTQIRAVAFGASPATAAANGPFAVPQSPQLHAQQQQQQQQLQLQMWQQQQLQAQAAAQVQAQQQQQPQPLLNLSAARTNTFVAAAAVQQNPQLMQQLMGKAMAGAQPQQRTPVASPAASPQIRPAQPLASPVPRAAAAAGPAGPSAGTLGIRTASGPAAPAPAPAPAAAAVSRQKSAPQQAAAALSATLSMLSSAPMSSTTAVAVSQSLGIPLLKPIAQQQQPQPQPRGALAGVRV